MINRLRITNAGTRTFKALTVGFLLIVLGSAWVTQNWNTVSADIFDWSGEDQKAGVYGFLRQLPSYQKKDGDEFTFYARKTIWVFGEGEVMLLEWLPQDTKASEFKIRFSYLTASEVGTLARMKTKAGIAAP